MFTRHATDRILAAMRLGSALVLATTVLAAMSVAQVRRTRPGTAGASTADDPDLPAPASELPRTNRIDPPLTDIERLTLRRPSVPSDSGSSPNMPIDGNRVALAPNDEEIGLVSGHGDFTIFNYRKGCVVFCRKQLPDLDVSADWSSYIDGRELCCGLSSGAGHVHFGLPVFSRGSRRQNGGTRARPGEQVFLPLPQGRRAAPRAYSPDGKLLWLSEVDVPNGSDRKGIFHGLWDVEKEQLRWEKKGNFLPAAFSADSGILALTPREAFLNPAAAIELVETATGKSKSSIPFKAADFGNVFRIALSPKGDCLAALGDTRAASGQGKKRLAAFDSANGTRRWQMDGPDPDVNVLRRARVEFSPDGRFMLAQWPVNNAVHITVLSAAHGEIEFEADRFLAAAFSPDGKLLALGGRESTVLLLPTGAWQAGDGVARVLDECTGLCFSRNSDALAVLGEGRGLLSAVIYNLKSREMVARVNVANKLTGRLRFTPGGERLLCAASDGSLRIYDVAGNRPPAALGSAENATDVVATSLDGTKIVSGGYEGAVLLRDAASGRVLRRFKADASGLRAVACLGNGSTVMAATRRKVVFWDGATGRVRKEFQSHARGSNAVCLAGDSSMLVSAGIGPIYGELAGFHCPDFKQTFLIQDSPAIDDIAISPDREFVATGGQNSVEIALRSARNGDVLRTFPGYRREAGGLAFSADGRCLAIGSQAPAARLGTRFPVTLLDPRSGKVLWEHTNHESGIVSLAIARKSDLVASIDDAGRVCIAKVSSGEIIRRFALQPAVALPQLPAGDGDSAGNVTR